MRLERTLLMTYIFLLAAAFGVGAAAGVRASGGTVYFIVGMATSEATISYHPDSCGTDYWHCDEQGRPNQTALDLTNSLGSTAGAAIWFQASSTQYVSAYAHFDVFPPGTYCPEVRATMLIEVGGSWISGGTIDYIHTQNVNISSGTEIWVGWGWSLLDLGDVVMASGCGAAHSHQSGTHGPTYMWTNWSVESDDDGGIAGRQISPTGSYWVNYLHYLSY